MWRLHSIAPSYRRLWSPCFSISSRQLQKLSPSPHRHLSASVCPLRPRVHLDVLYGSQTGTAQLFATQLTHEAHAHNAVADLINLNTFSPHILKPSNEDEKRIMVFVMATFGKGEPTDNAKQFYEWIMSKDRDREKESGKFSGIDFAVFGLGQSCTYKENYQKVPMEISRRLNSLGAKEIVPRGEGDAAHDIDNDFDNWSSEVLWPKVEELVSSDQTVTAKINSSASVQIPKASSEFVDLWSGISKRTDDTAEAPRSSPSSTFVDLWSSPKQLEEETVHDSQPSKPAPTVMPPKYSWDRPFDGVIAEVKLLTNPSRPYKVTKHVEFDISAAGEDMNYETGDYVSVLPSNHPRFVNSMLNILGEDGGQILESSIGIPRMPAKCTLIDALSNYLDIQSPPRRSVIRLLAEYATNPRDKHTLLNLGNSKSTDHYDQYVLRDNRGVAAILEDYPSVAIPAVDLVRALQPLRPRQYSIANVRIDSDFYEKEISTEQKALARQCDLRPGRLSICLHVLCGPAPCGRPWHGRMSYTLDKLRNVGESVPMFVTKSSVRLPVDVSVPVIMIAVGTGISLFRAMWQQRCILDRIDNPDSNFGENILFFGSDDPKDSFYSEELLQLEKQGSLIVHRTAAFDPREPSFIQHSLRKHGNEIGELLDKGAHLYICGHKAFGQAANRALVDVIMKSHECNYMEATHFVKEMKNTGRMVEEVFE